jgi:hypothetical protein
MAMLNLSFVDKMMGKKKAKPYEMVVTKRRIRANA